MIAVDNLINMVKKCAIYLIFLLKLLKIFSIITVNKNKSLHYKLCRKAVYIDQKSKCSKGSEVGFKSRL